MDPLTDFAKGIALLGVEGLFFVPWDFFLKQKYEQDPKVGKCTHSSDYSLFSSQVFYLTDSGEDEEYCITYKDFKEKKPYDFFSVCVEKLKEKGVYRQDMYYYQLINLIEEYGFKDIGLPDENHYRVIRFTLCNFDSTDDESIKAALFLAYHPVTKEFKINYVDNNGVVERTNEEMMNDPDWDENDHPREDTREYLYPYFPSNRIYYDGLIKFVELVCPIQNFKIENTKIEFQYPNRVGVMKLVAALKMIAGNPDLSWIVKSLAESLVKQYMESIEVPARCGDSVQTMRINIFPGPNKMPEKISYKFECEEKSIGIQRIKRKTVSEKVEGTFSKHFAYVPNAYEKFGIRNYAYLHDKTNYENHSPDPKVNHLVEKLRNSFPPGAEKNNELFIMKYYSISHILNIIQNSPHIRFCEKLEEGDPTRQTKKSKKQIKYEEKMMLVDQKKPEEKLSAEMQILKNIEDIKKLYNEGEELLEGDRKCIELELDKLYGQRIICLAEEQYIDVFGEETGKYIIEEMKKILGEVCYKRSMDNAKANYKSDMLELEKYTMIEKLKKEASIE